MSLPRPQELAKFAYAEEFARHQRHGRRWVKVTAVILFALAVGPAVWGIFSQNWILRLGWIIPAGIGLVLLRGLAAYAKGSLHCPHCREDITNCAAKCCHVCGEPLKEGRCSRCGVDSTWTAIVQPLSARPPIVYCPGCGVYLNTTFYRFEYDGD